MIENWLANALQEYYLGPGRQELVEKIKRRLRSEAKTGRTDRKRLEKQAADLDRQVDRLVKAIRTTDAPELVDALDQARRERQSVQEALRQAVALRDLDGIDQAAEAW